MIKKIFNLKYLLALAIILGLSACSTNNEMPTKIDNTSCSVNSDCSVKTIECGCCATAISCVNDKWELDCPEPDYSYKNHPCETFSCARPTPPWFDNCQCINNSCANCLGDDCETE